METVQGECAPTRLIVLGGHAGADLKVRVKWDVLYLSAAAGYGPAASLEGGEPGQNPCRPDPKRDLRPGDSGGHLILGRLPRVRVSGADRWGLRLGR